MSMSPVTRKWAVGNHGKPSCHQVAHVRILQRPGYSFKTGKFHGSAKLRYSKLHSNRSISLICLLKILEGRYGARSTMMHRNCFLINILLG